MEKKIKQLIELSETYFDWAVKMNLKDGEHNYLRVDVKGMSHLTTYPFTIEDVDKPEIRVYFNDNKKTKSFNIGDIEFKQYCKSFAMPYDITEDQLNYIYEDALSFYNNWLSNQPLPSEEDFLISKQEEIDELEARLKALKETA